MTFTDLNWRLALLALFFVALVLVLLAVRSVKLLRRSCDPCVFIDAENRLYPPKPPVPPVHGPVAWLSAALTRKEEMLRTYCSLDEIMLIRWFEMSARLFGLAVAIVGAPLLVAYWVVSKDSLGDQLEGRVASLSLLSCVVVAAENEQSAGDIYNDWAPWLVCSQLYLFSGLMLAMVTQETRMYARKLWEQDPTVLGAQLHAVLLSDVPTLHEEELRVTLDRHHDAGALAALRLAVRTVATLVVFVFVDVLPGWIVVDWVRARRAKREDQAADARQSVVSFDGGKSLPGSACDNCLNCCLNASAVSSSDAGERRERHGAGASPGANGSDRPRSPSSEDEIAGGAPMSSFMAFESLKEKQLVRLTRAESRDLVRSKLESFFGEGEILYQVRPASKSAREHASAHARARERR